MATLWLRGMSARQDHEIGALDMARKYLRQDETGNLRLVFADLWNGQHERTEFSVVSGDGSPVRTRGDLDGSPVYGERGDWYVRAPNGARMPVRTQASQQSQAVKTPCRRQPVAARSVRCVPLRTERDHRGQDHYR